MALFDGSLGTLNIRPISPSPDLRVYEFFFSIEGKGRINLLIWVFLITYRKKDGKAGKVGFGETGSLSDAAMAIFHIFGVLRRKKMWIL